MFKNIFYKEELIIKLFFLLIPLLFVIGPGILDLFLTISSLVILLLLIQKKKLIINNKYLIFFFIIYLYLNFVSFISDDIFNSLPRSITFIRYIIIFLVINSILINYKIENLFYLFLSSIFLVYLIVTNQIYQFYFGNDFFGNSIINNSRISGFYGEDYIAGQVLYILSLPSLMFTLVISKNKLFNLFFFLTLIIILFGILLSGQRTALFNFLLSLALLILVFKNNFKINFLTFFIASLVSLITFFYFIPSFYKRFIEVSFSQLSNYLNTSYSAFNETAINLWLQNPIFGVGLKNYRNMCSNNLYISTYTGEACSTHPHNINLEILSELGTIGFLLFFSFFIFYFLNVYKNIINIDIKLKYYLTPFFLTTIPIVFSILPSGSFFTNAHAIPFWLYFSLASVSVYFNRN